MDSIRIACMKPGQGKKSRAEQYAVELTPITVKGVWALHKALNKQGEPMEHAWTVTHIHAGMRIVTCDTREEARYFLNALYRDANVGAGWAWGKEPELDRDARAVQLALHSARGRWLRRGVEANAL
jgi:hypothetical protein